MKAMLLSAGFGMRLRPLTEATPKPLLPLGGVPILGWNLLLLKRHGITDAVINLHHLGERIVETLRDGSQYSMRLAYSHEPALLGTGGGIKQAEPFLKDGTFLVLNGDTVSECDLTGLVSAHRVSGALATLALREDPAAEEWGAVATNRQGRILQIKNQPPVMKDTEASASWMFAGIHVLEPAVLDAIPAGPGSIIDVYITLLRQGGHLQGWRMTGYWSDIGTRERYAQAQKDVERGCLRPAH